MKLRDFLVLVGAVLLFAVTGCDKANKEASDEDSGASGIGTIDAAPALVDKAMGLAADAWPGAEVGGLMVSFEVPPDARANTYSLRVSFEFDSDPTDATVKSGSVICSPECQLVRHKVKRQAAAAFPCPLEQALTAARAAGLSTEQPHVAYGYWNLDGREGWTFREEKDGEPVVVGEGCAVR